MDQVPPRGYSLLEAFRSLLPERHLRITSTIMLGKSFQGPSEAAEVIRLRGVLWAELSSRLQAGVLVATGFSHGTTIPEQIHPAFFNNAVPDYAGDAVSMNGATYAGVRVFSADAMATTQEAVSADTRPEPGMIASPSRLTSARKGVGGAPPSHPWDDFVVEVVRFANTSGFATRAELTKHMRAWVEQSWATQPDADTIRRKVREICPPEIPPN